MLYGVHKFQFLVYQKTEADNVREHGAAMRLLEREGLKCCRGIDTDHEVQIAFMDLDNGGHLGVEDLMPSPYYIDRELLGADQQWHGDLVWLIDHLPQRETLLAAHLANKHPADGDEGYAEGWREGALYWTASRERERMYHLHRAAWSRAIGNLRDDILEAQRLNPSGEGDDSAHHFLKELYSLLNPLTDLWAAIYHCPAASPYLVASVRMLALTIRELNDHHAIRRLGEQSSATRRAGASSDP